MFYLRKNFPQKAMLMESVAGDGLRWDTLSSRGLKAVGDPLLLSNRRDRAFSSSETRWIALPSCRPSCPEISTSIKP